jgi:hypothetical protein
LKAELVHGVVVKCPELFRRKDFAEFVNKFANVHDKRRLATWHTAGEMHENSDVFLNFDGGRLSEEDQMPEEVAELLRELVENTLPNDRANHNKYAIVWLQNVRPTWSPADRTKTVTRIGQLLLEVTDSFEERKIGADLAHLLLALLDDTACEWPADHLIVRLLREHTAETDMIWDFITIEETKPT